MALSKSVSEYKSDIDLDFQLLSAELDTHMNDLRCLSNIFLTDGIQEEQFEEFVNDIKTEWEYVSSLDDNSDIYESGEKRGEIYVILYESIYSKFILFDKRYKQKIEGILSRK